MRVLLTISRRAAGTRPWRSARRSEFGCSARSRAASLMPKIPVANRGYLPQRWVQGLNARLHSEQRPPKGNLGRAAWGAGAFVLGRADGRELGHASTCLWEREEPPVTDSGCG